MCIDSTHPEKRAPPIRPAPSFTGFVDDRYLTNPIAPGKASYVLMAWQGGSWTGGTGMSNGCSPKPGAVTLPV